ncbi:MAG: hypothetical protein KME09_04195 [Pleurocapsa minor HA4230-MV1]|jgi:hypothetical protein|nr:hypothetical protein [Pleurocapsa minor HA4230-MV1]
MLLPLFFFSQIFDLFVAHVFIRDRVITLLFSFSLDSCKRSNLIESPVALCDWLESYFGFPVELQQNLSMGFPDDTISPGATIVSTATLEAIASWYPELDTADIRRRFRAN